MADTTKGSYRRPDGARTPFDDTAMNGEILSRIDGLPSDVPTDLCLLRGVTIDLTKWPSHTYHY